MHGKVGTVLAYLNCHMCIMLVVVLTLVSGLGSDSNLLIYLLLAVWSLLAITVITAYLITSDVHAPKYIKQVAYHWAGLGLLVYLQWHDTIPGTMNMYNYNYLVSLDLRMLYLPFCHGPAYHFHYCWQTVNSLIFHDDNKCSYYS